MSASRQGIPRKVLLVMLIAVVLGVGGAIGWALTGENDEPTTASTIPRATTTVIPTTTTSPDERLREARSDWEDFQASFAGDLTPTRAALVDGRPTATTVNTTTGEIVVWEYNANGEWFEADSVMLDFGNDLPYVDDIKLIDVTDDGSAEVYVQYFPGNHTVGNVYRHESEQWNLVAAGTGLVPDGNGSTVLRGVENTCVPDCAAGNYFPYTYTWNGRDFTYQTYDNVGNPAFFVVTTVCPKPYNANNSLPLSRCDKGEKVRALQAALAREGFLAPSEVDGYFGPGTETAVRYYQLSRYLEVNGVVGDWYWQLIER